MTKNNPQSEFVTVCFHNFDRISKKLILLHLKDPKYSIELMEEPEDSDVCFFNQENVAEQAEIKALHKQLNSLDVPMILLTAEEHFVNNKLLTVIQKPLENLRLNDCLSQVKETFYAVLMDKLKRKSHQDIPKLIYNKHLSNAINPEQIQFEYNRFYAQKYVGLNPDIDFTLNEQLEKVQMNPKNYFFYYLKDAYGLSKAKKRITCVKTVYGVFYIDAQNKVIYHDKTADEIKSIHKIPFYKDTQVTVPKFKREEFNQVLQLNQFDYEPFVWLSSINASKGKIPIDVDFNAPVNLVAWPDLTKLLVFKHAIRIIALWSRGVYSLKHTGKLLKVPQRYPLTVYTALHALGLIDEMK